MAIFHCYVSSPEGIEKKHPIPFFLILSFHHFLLAKTPLIFLEVQLFFATKIAHLRSLAVGTLFRGICLPNSTNSAMRNTADTPIRGVCPLVTGQTGLGRIFFGEKNNFNGFEAHFPEAICNFWRCGPFTNTLMQRMLLMFNSYKVST